MRTTFFTLFLLLLIGGIQAQNKQSVVSQKPKVQSIENEMQNYFMVILSKGPNREQDSTELERLQEGHMENIARLAKDGKLILVGPFLDDGTLRGIFIFDVATKEEVKKLVDSDPTVKAGRMVYEIHPWLGPKTLKNILSETFKTQK